MNQRPPLFISHSSAPDAVQEELLQLIEAEFGGSLELLIDQKLLAAGDDWRHEIYTWMGICRAALVLLSKGVIERPNWVRTEAAILEWRESLARVEAAQRQQKPETVFLLIPVLLPGFPPEKTAELLDPVALNRLQHAAGATAAEIMAELRPRLQALAAQPAAIDAPLRKLVDALGAQLEAMHFTDGECLGATAFLGGGEAGGGPRERLARILAHAALDDVANCLLKYSTKERKDGALEILRLLSNTWINPAAVARLPDVAQQPPAQRAAALDSARIDTARFYVHRAYCNYPPGCLTFDLNNNFAGNAADEARGQIMEQLKKDLVGEPEDEVKNQFDLYFGSGVADPTFLLLSGDLRPATLRLLQGGLPHCTLLLASPLAFADPAAYRDTALHFLDPRVDAAKERAYVNAKNKLLIRWPK